MTCGGSSKHLPHHGLKITGIGPEDWSWMVELDNEQFPLCIGCGHQHGENDESKTGCLVPRPPFKLPASYPEDTQNCPNQISITGLGPVRAYYPCEWPE
jgi:hypothetical protein